MQVQRTLPGEYFNLHHDFDTTDYFRHAGPRLWTFMIYTTTLALGEGGHTEFPFLNIKVRPQKGRALVWPNTFEHTLVRDPRTFHAGLEVRAGVKHAVNINVHSHTHSSHDEETILGGAIARVRRYVLSAAIDSISG